MKRKIREAIAFHIEGLQKLGLPIPAPGSSTFMAEVDLPGGAGDCKRTAQYLVVVEQTPDNWSAYVPDVRGCVTTGKTREEVERNIMEALTGHFAVMHDSGEPIPEPGTWTAVVEVEVPDEASVPSVSSPAEAR